MHPNLKPFPVGQSGNPAGRPKGSTTKLKLLEMAGDVFTDEDLADVVAKVFEMAKQGDLRAIEMILDRTIPKVKAIPEQLTEDDLAERLKAARARVDAYRRDNPPPQLIVVTGVPASEGGFE